MWPDCSNTNDRAVNGAALTAMGCTTLTAKASQGSGFTDGLVGANYAQAKGNALDFIAYHFLDTSDGAAQAEHFVNVVESACGRLDLGLMVDWEKCDGSFAAPATVDAFLERLAQLAPKAAISVYTAAWVIEGAGGPSSVATKYPLVWPNYVPPNPPAPAEDPHKIVDGVTPGFFEAFGGWTSYAARQFTDNACAGGFAVVDFNVCFDEDAYARLVVPQSS
jgi:GH25 family lysozyme M1 (1,4-beta-N-acetylmuramidase)